jgi:hypothetical protein
MTFIRVYVGELFLGKTDSFDCECIKTKFSVVGFPLSPIESYYVTPSDQRSPFFDEDLGEPMAMAIGFWRYTLIRSHTKSILAAYVRWWGSLAWTIIVAVIVLHMPSRDVNLLWFLAAEIFWILLLLVWPSGTSKQDMRKRQALARATGVGAWPEIQHAYTTERVHQALARDWHAKHDEKSGQRIWTTLAPADVKPTDLAHYYALARYASVIFDGDKWAEMAEGAWRRLEATAAD